MPRPTRSALSAPALEVAPTLLGARLSATGPEGRVTVVLTEVEAYEGTADPASHAFAGPTGRNRVMFGEAGHLYVYRSHGLHWCCNLVTGNPGTASAVLLRAGLVVEGEGIARERRGDRVADAGLARGPGNLGQALGITGADDGEDVISGRRLRLRFATGPGPTVLAGPRVGVSRAADRPWRFWIAGDPTVSAYRRSPRAPSSSVRGGA